MNATHYTNVAPSSARGRHRATLALRIGADRAALLSSLLLAVSVTGCSVQATRIAIVDYRNPGDTQTYHEVFDECYYDIDPDGNINLVLRRSSGPGADPSEAIAQVLHVRSFWRSIPGSTVAHKTQLNATITYHIAVGQSTSTFEGAGSVFFKEKRDNETITGSIALAVLSPTQRVSSNARLFKRAELYGTFRATRNPQRVVHLMNALSRR